MIIIICVYVHCTFVCVWYICMYMYIHVRGRMCVCVCVCVYVCMRVCDNMMEQTKQHCSLMFQGEGSAFFTSTSVVAMVLECM